MNKPVKIFCRYLNEDVELYRQFEEVLASLQRQGIVSEWYGSVILSGTEWSSTVDQKLERADLIVPLLSAGLISSGYCSGKEMARALARHDNSEALVVPLIINSSIWQATPLHRLKVLPIDGKAVTSQPNRKEAWSQLADEIRNLAETPLLRPFYKEMCAGGLQALLTGQMIVAPFLDDLSKDKRLGLTLVVRPSPEIAKQLLAINNRLKKVCPRQFYYDYDQPRFHFTLLSLVDAYDPPKVTKKLARRFVQPIEEVLSSLTPFKVEFVGVCPTPSGFIAKGFPIGDGLEDLRRALRKRLHDEGLGDGIDERYRVQGAHVTIGRFMVGQNLPQLAKVFEQLDERSLGSMHVQQAQLVINDFYMSPDKLSILAEFPIGQPASQQPSLLPVGSFDRFYGEKEIMEVQTPPAGRLISSKQRKPTIGIITALPKEYAAATLVIENQRPCNIPGRGAGRRYLQGEVPGPENTRHAVVLSLNEMGNNISATRATRLLEHFASVQYIIMVGIAGGIPYPQKPAEHVRLGDVVVSDHRGVLQYDFVKETITEIIPRNLPRPPSATFLEGVWLLKANEIGGQRPWQAIAQRILDRLHITRPPNETDILADSQNSQKIIPHPHDSQRVEGQPRIFIGPIASSNTLLKNPLKRDALRDKFGVKAVEMEGSGIADATWNHEVGYLIVRGISDYCDMNKGDDWQEYAAVVAAAYTRALLESMPGQIPEMSETAQSKSPKRIRHNVPILPINVVGRQDEHSHILRSLCQADQPVILASGYGGIGKSTLARMVAWTCIESKKPFDLIVWLDIRQYGDEQTLSLNSILDTIAKIADSGSNIPGISVPETKQDLVQKVLGSHRSLLILDNYESLLTDPEEERKVSAFLDSLPAGTMDGEEGLCIRVLITTREVSRGLRVLPIEELRLESLSLEDSVKLMKIWAQCRIKLSDYQYRRVWELLHGLPKYMKEAINQLKTTNFHQWENIITNIKVPFDEHERFWKDLFQYSWARFSEEFKEILMSLTYFVGEAPAEALQRTSGLSERAFTMILGSVSDDHIESTGTGYTTHPLTHAFFQAILNSTGNKEYHLESSRRFVEYYSEFANNAHINGRSDLLEREIKNIVAAVKLSRKLKLLNDLIALQQSVAGFMRFRGYWHELIEIGQQAEEAFREAGEERMLAECLVNNLAWYHLRLEDLLEADRCAKEGVFLFEKLNDLKGVAQGKRHLGKSALVKGLDCYYEPAESWQQYYPISERYYRESLKIRDELAVKAIDQSREIADMKLDFGRLYWLHGKWLERDGRRRMNKVHIEEALTKYEQALHESLAAMNIFESLQDDRGIAKAWGNLGNATKEMVRFRLEEGQASYAVELIMKTHEYYERSLQTAELIRRRDEIAHAEWGLAEVYELYADYPALHNNAGNRRVLIERALSLAEESHSKYSFLGGAKDIRATENLVERIRNKLSRF